MKNIDVAELAAIFITGLLTIVAFFTVDLLLKSHPSCPTGTVAIQGRCLVEVKPS